MPIITAVSVLRIDRGFCTRPSPSRNWFSRPFLPRITIQP